MYEIAILNPRPADKVKKGKHMASRRRRKLSAKQIAAGFGGKRRKNKKHHAKARRVDNPRRSSAKRRVANPRRAVMGYVVGKRPIRRRKMNPSVRSYHRRRNPRFSVRGAINRLMPAALGASGAIALDVALGYLPLPEMLKSGYAKHATRIAGALGIGWAARKFLGPKYHAVGSGALTVAMYMLIKDVIVKFAPTVKGLGDYEEIAIDNTADQIGAYMNGVGAYLPDGSTAPGMGAYLAGDDDSQVFGNRSFDVEDTAGNVMSGLGGLDY